jgi:hypothetical protein
MVSRATKRFWKSVALGLALSPAIGVEGVGRGQTMNPPAATAALPPGAPPSKPATR